jgi:hypothetical protein
MFRVRVLISVRFDFLYSDDSDLFGRFGRARIGICIPFHLYGYGADVGALVGILFFAQIVLCAILGGILELTDRGNQPGIGVPVAARCMDKMSIILVY